MNDAPLIPIAPNEIHVWLADLDPDSPDLDRTAATLSADERQRANHFRFEADRRRYALGRGYLREILSQYVGRPAESIRFDYGPNGKPALPAALPEGDGLEFNLSHAHACALYAVARGFPVGVDIEFLRPGFADALIAEQFFSERECGELRALPDGQQCEAFFNCWTRKEAFVKANGVGLSFGLQDFDVSLTPGAAPRIASIRKGNERAEDWRLFSFAPRQGFVAAVAAKCAEARLAGECRQGARAATRTGAELYRCGGLQRTTLPMQL